MVEKLKFLTDDYVRNIAEEFGTPLFVYSQTILEKQAEKVLEMPNAYGLTVRYAMKANPSSSILQVFARRGLHLDASSGFEVKRAIMAGVYPEKILLTTQQLPENLYDDYLNKVDINLTSLEQIRKYGNSFSGVNSFGRDNKISIRVNPGFGSGGTNRTNVGGPSSSFGIWHENFEVALKLINGYNFEVKRLHTHIGSGSDSKVWEKVASMSLEYAKRLIKLGHPLEVLNLGGGYKVGRMSYENSIDFIKSGEIIKKAFEDFYNTTGIKLKLEIEPGTFLVANAGSLIARVIDIVETSGYTFIKTDTGMTEITRPALYGAQHPLVVVSQKSEFSRSTKNYVVVGHCCESGDILTPEVNNPEELNPRNIREVVIGDFLVVEGVGAYCASMSVKNYNSFPEAAEVLIDNDNISHLIRKRQTLSQIVQNEIVPCFFT